MQPAELYGVLLLLDLADWVLSVNKTNERFLTYVYSNGFLTCISIITVVNAHKIMWIAFIQKFKFINIYFPEQNKADLKKNVDKSLNNLCVFKKV